MSKIEIKTKDSSLAALVAFSSEQITIGRQSDNDIVLKDLVASRKHCLIIKTTDSYILKDLGSDNGTWIGQKRVQEENLHLGQFFRIGTTTIRMLPDEQDSHLSKNVIVDESESQAVVPLSIESSGSMSRGAKVFVIIGATLLVGMIGYVVTDMILKNHKKNLRVENLFQAKQFIQGGEESTVHGSYLDAANKFESAINLLPDRDKRNSEESEVAAIGEAALAKIRPIVNDERERIRKENERIAQVERDHAAELAEKKETVRLEQEKKKKEEDQARLVSEKARQMYPDYKRSAEALADEILRLQSATEVGINKQDYSKRLQELRYAYNKFDIAHREYYLSYKSSLHLKLAVVAFQMAQAAWDFKIENLSNKEAKELAEKQIQDYWKDARNHYEIAMAALAKNE